MRQYIPPVFNVSLHSTCFLQCEFCMKTLDKYKRYKPIEFDKFKRYIDIMTNYGVTMFELTPTVGDPLALSPDVLQRYLDYLENHDKVEMYFFYTSLITRTAMADGQYDFLLDRDKFMFHVSLYSVNINAFMSRTKGTKKQYDILKRNMLYVIDNRERLPTVLIDRTKHENLFNQNDKPPPEPDILFRRVVQVLKSPSCRIFIQYSSPDWSYSDTKKHISDKKHHGICTYMLMDGGIYPDGKVSLCTWIDSKKQMIVGDLNNDAPEDIYKDFWTVDSTGLEQLNEKRLKFNKKYYCCNNCDFASPAGPIGSTVEENCEAIKQEFRDQLEWLKGGPDSLLEILVEHSC